MEDAEECRQQADNLTRLARSYTNPEVRGHLIRLATTWKALAGQMDRLAQRDPCLALRIARLRSRKRSPS